LLQQLVSEHVVELVRVREMPSLLQKVEICRWHGFITNSHANFDERKGWRDLFWNRRAHWHGYENNTRASAPKSQLARKHGFCLWRGSTTIEKRKSLSSRQAFFALVKLQFFLIVI